MAKMKAGWALLAVVTMTLMLTMAPMFAGSVLAVKKSSSARPQVRQVRQPLLQLIMSKV
jgi:hypothetical protein